jgi:plastocyanin
MGRMRVWGLAAVAAIVASVVSANAVMADDPPRQPQEAIPEKMERFKPKAPGTKETLKYYFGPYVVPPGHDANRVDIDLPVHDGYIVSIEPGMRRVGDLTEPGHQEAHIHHAHWFALDPGNKEDNYTRGNTEWIFGNGDEETKADFAERSAAEPNGPIYGQYVGAAGPQLMIYMLHNKTSQPLNVWIALDVTFIHGTKDALKNKGGRPFHDVSGVLFGRTFDVPRQPDGDGKWLEGKDTKPVEWVSTVDGTMIGTGGHLHPGGTHVDMENMGPKENPCPNDGRGPQGGTTVYRGDALFRHDVKYSEDFQMEVTHPAWRAPIRKGDRIRITGTYENKDHAWYTAMVHAGIYIDEQQAPKGRCKPYLVGGVEEKRTVTKLGKKKVRWSISKRGKLIRKARRERIRTEVGIDPIEGVQNRPWGKHQDLLCGIRGWPACDKPEARRPPGRQTNVVNIANFLYVPGDMSLAGEDGAPPRIKEGTSLRFVNEDQAAGIRHTVTTCPWPCNGQYVANYPLADGLWDSTTLGYDPIDGGNPNPVAETPKDLKAGKYAYFCRIHPWMRGAFEVEK